MSTSSTPDVGGSGTSPSKTEQTRRIVAIALGAVAVLFAALNFDEVEVNWLFGTWSTPLIIVIAVSFLLGVGVGRLVLPRVTAARADRARKAKAE